MCSSGGRWSGGRLTCHGVYPQCLGLSHRQPQQDALPGGGRGAGLGMGMGVPTGLAAMGDPRPPLLAASYSTGAPTGPPSAAHSLLARPLLHPLQPPPAKKLRMDDPAMTFKTDGEDPTGLASEISELQKENASMEGHVTKLRHDVSSMEAALKAEQKVTFLIDSLFLSE
ncbi:hypothetical protein SK128_009617 [Halocaridina rubra]|uniref:Uncharacterized protein n=1 Tax=Halocaridina rubra TaxID=373956 RepID=A0AAN8XFI0_HALRR